MLGKTIDFRRGLRARIFCQLFADKIFRRTLTRRPGGMPLWWEHSDSERFFSGVPHPHLLGVAVRILFSGKFINGSIHVYAI